MSRQLEQAIEERSSRVQAQALLALYGGLEGAVAYAGGELTGFSIKCGNQDYLMTLRARFPSGPVVAWVGAGGLPELMVKATREAKGDALRWKADKYG